MELVLCVLMVLECHVPGLGDVVFQELVAAALYSAYSHRSS